MNTNPTSSPPEAPTAPDSEPLGVALPRLVRLLAQLHGTYCQLQKGEEVLVSPMTGGKWRVERRIWINTLTIFNVLTGIPNDALIFDESNEPALALGGGGKLTPKPETTSNEKP